MSLDHFSNLSQGNHQAAFDDLPPPNTTRWVMRRKAQVVHAVKKGVLSMEAALARYNISEEEFRSWQQLIDRHGVRALRATRLQEYRAPDGSNKGDDAR